MFKFAVLSLFVVVAFVLVEANIDEKGVSMMDLISPKGEQGVHPFYGCTVCMSVVRDIKSFAEDPTKIKKIKRELSMLCKACPNANGQAKCNELLDKNFAKFVNYMHKTDPLKVCNEMHLCPSEPESLPRLLEDLLGSRMRMQQY